MIANSNTTQTDYTYASNNVVRVSPMMGLTLGWRDCAESFNDWRDLMTPDADSRQHKALFNLLGQPLERTSSYNAPWDDYLQFPGDAIWVGGAE